MTTGSERLLAAQYWPCGQRGTQCRPHCAAPNACEPSARDERTRQPKRWEVHYQPGSEQPRPR
eukprot:10163222-Alexandrium_andersonii.AAC.1